MPLLMLLLRQTCSVLLELFSILGLASNRLRVDWIQLALSVGMVTVLAPALHAGAADGNLDRAVLTASYEQEALKIVPDYAGMRHVESEYLKALDVLFNEFKKQGDFDNVTAVMAERKRFEVSKTVPDSPAEVLPPAVIKIQAIYHSAWAKIQAENNRKKASLLRSYLAALKGHIKALLEKDRMDEAKESNDELKRAEADLATLESKFNAWGVAATGGTITNYVLDGISYCAHIFTSNGMLVISTGGSVDVLVVGGGGGGGNGYGGGAGGGAGGLVYATNYVLADATFAVTVGAGGRGADEFRTYHADPGGNSIFGEITALGGARCMAQAEGAQVGQSGGSGSGGHWDAEGGSSTQSDSGGAKGYGHAGGYGVSGGAYGGGGGGGAGGAGGDGTTSRGGAGGVGLPFSISGVSTYYAGGGGGGRNTSGTPAAGGLGGGGSGNFGIGGTACASTGGGGGGGGFGSAVGGSGGSGIVIIRYPKSHDKGVECSAVKPPKPTASEPRYKIVKYRYDSTTAKGVLAVDISSQGIEARKWVLKNIGEIASSKELLLEAGKETIAGGRYSVLDEVFADGILTVNFEVLH